MVTSSGVTAPPWLTSAPSTNTMVAAMEPVSEKFATTRTGEVVVAPPTGETMVTVCAKENVDASRTKPAAGRGKILKTTSRIVLQVRGHATVAAKVHKNL